MRNVKEISAPAPIHFDTARERVSSWHAADLDRLASELETNGVVVLPNLFSAEQLHGMQAAFNSRLRRLRWNNFEGYQKTEPYRHMIEDVLLLDQGFLDLAVHPLVNGILREYLGPDYELAEAKGWKSLPTKRDFHGWHGDIWYDQSKTKKICKEIKLGMYLTDVRSGAFNFIKGSHQKQHPHNLKRGEVRELDFSELFELTGPAGTVFLFDTSAVHRQGLPMLEERQAIFYAYHDPSVPLQQEDIDYYRYHPLLLNAAFLGNLSGEDRRILGFGNKTNFQPAFERHDRPPLTNLLFDASLGLELRAQQLRERIVAKLKRPFG
jgi:hypothetical protein